MSDDQAREALAAQLRSLSLPEFVDVLRRVLPVYRDGQVRNGLIETLVLAEACRLDPTMAGAVDDADVMLSVVGWPDRDYYDGGFGPEPDLWESGTCHGCGVEVLSTAKRAFCPVCGEGCQLT